MISIVDDDASICDATRALIRSLGYMARTFRSAEEFLVSDEATESCCLITDVQLAGLNGLELQRRLIAAGSKIPIIFITAFSDENVRNRALDAGAIGFLIKPFEEEHLIACLQKALSA